MMTVKQAAEKWGVSPSQVRKWIAQDRLSWTRPGHEILISSARRPAPLARGGLSPAQRGTWPR